MVLQSQLRPYKLLDEIGGFGDTQHGRIDAEVIALGSSPALVAVVVVVLGTTLLYMVDLLFCLSGADAFQTGDALDTRGHRGRDEDVDTTGVVAQHIVGTTTDEQTGLLVGQFADGIALQLKQGIVAEIVHGAGG